MEKIKHIVNGLRIAKALASDYISIYYIDIEDDSFIEYRSTDEYQELGIEREGEDFFTVSKHNAQRLIHPDDQEAFIAAIDKSNLLAALEGEQTFMLNYRMMFDGAPKYVQLKVSRMGGGDDRHIVIGILDIDELVRAREALHQIRREQTAYSRIFALSGDYICIYTVDLEDGSYTVFSTMEGFEDLGLTKDGEDFFADAHRDSEKSVYREDLELFNTMFTRERVIQSIRETGIYALNYRMVIDGRPVYVCLKAAVVTEEGREKLVVGTTNIDAQVRRDMGYAHDLSVARMKASRDALTGVKNRSAYLDVEAKINRRIRDGEAVQFAVVVCDLNNLKQTNDSFGHQAGDRLLKNACSIICGVFKHSPVFRVGGDEFAVISQGHDYDHMDELMDKMRRSNARNDASGGTVIACGMARYDHDSSVAAVFERADRKMYEDKKILKEA
jgi:diguanylate cyclase (GGDEF)-like protein